MFIDRREIRLTNVSVNRPAVLFILATTLSLGIGMLPLIPGAGQASKFAQFGGWLLYTFSVGALLMVGNLVHDVRWLKAYTWVFLLLGGIFLVACWRYGVNGAAQIFFRLGISTGIFWTMLAVVGLGQCLSNKDLAWKWRIFAGAVSLFGLAFGWMRGKEWIAGWLPAVIAVGVMLLRGLQLT
jgi:hypothetical protein